MKHINKNPKQQKERAAYIVPAIAGLVIAVVTSYMTYRWGLSTQIQLTEKQRRQQAYGELMGRKAMMAQLLVSRFEAWIYSDYHEAHWRLAGKPAASLDNQEAQRWMHKSEDLVLEIAKNKQSLFETLGLVRTSFPNTPELQRLTDRVYKFKHPEILGGLR